jgi:hypothetical protein
MALIMVAAPIMAAGRGWRSFVLTGIVEISLLLLLAISEGSAIILGSSPYFEMLMLGSIAFVALPMTMGGIVLYAKHAEKLDPGTHCRVCGYDLRATPERCPECGTLVHSDPDQF